MRGSVRTINRWLLGLLLAGLIAVVLAEWINFRQVTHNLEWAVDQAEQINTQSLDRPSAHLALEQVTQSLENAHQRITVVGTLLMSVGMAGIGFVIMVVVFLRRRVAQPMERLRQGIHRIIEGDLDHRLELEGGDELNDLAQSFNFMAEQLQQNTDRLYFTNADLIQTNQYLERHRRNLEESNQQLEAEIVTRKKTEQTLEATIEHLRIANRDLEEFAAVAAHDLKTPLRGIGTLADLFRQDYEERLDERGLQLLDMLGQRTQRIHGLVGGILKYARMTQSGAIPLRQVKTREVVEHAIEHVHPPEHIDIVIDGDLPDVVCEEVQLYQVFQNLIDNAVIYNDKPKGLVQIRGTCQADSWSFSVTDNGPGIPEKQQDKIFKIFHTLESKDDCGTTGIGLSLVRKIVERYGGRVWVESEPGIGSTFFFTIKKHDLVSGEEAVHVLVERRREDRRRAQR